MKRFLMALPALLKIAESVAVWADPRRREVVKLRMAVEAASHLFMVRDKSGPYSTMTERYREKYRVHWTKRWEAFKDGL